MNIYAAPTCSFEAFVAHLTGSPAAPEASELWTIFVGYGIDPAVALGFFHHESNCGQAGRAVQTRSWGNLRWHDEYARLPYVAGEIDGFVAYARFSDAAQHFCEHLVGTDGTHNYVGLTTIEEVIPIWAPAPTNSPPDYIAAVITTVGELRGASNMTKPRVLLCAGHVNIQNIGSDRIGQESADILRRATGAGSEADWNGWMTGALMDALNATGLVDAAANDAIYSRSVYKEWLPNVVLWSHFHRDHAEERAIVSAPDPAVFGPRLNCEESQRLKERILGGYTQATGIPVTQQFENPNTTQFYGYWYPEPSAAVVLIEFGNSQDGLDAAALWGPDNARIVAYIRDCVLEHLNLSTTPTPPPPDPPTPPPSEPPTARTKAVIVGEIRTRLDELEALP